MHVSSFGCARKLMTGTHVPVRLVSGLTQTLVDWGHGGRACDLFSPEANGSGDPSFCARTSPEPEAMTDARVAVSHSAVSKALRRLEERLGVPLVRRTTRSVHLTEAGERLYASVRRRWTREPVFRAGAETQPIELPGPNHHGDRDDRHNRWLRGRRQTIPCLDMNVSIPATVDSSDGSATPQELAFRAS